MIKALHALNRDDIMLHILGDGNRLNSLKGYASKMGFDNIVYYGKRQSDSVVTALKLSDVVYVSLSSDLLMDSIPTKIYESIVLEKPTLLSASGDSADLLAESKMGVSISLEESDKIDVQIKEMIDDLDFYFINVGFANIM